MSKRVKKHIVLSGMPILNGNRGVGALATSTLYILMQIAEKNNWELVFYHLGRTEGIDIVKIENYTIKIKNVLYNRWDYLKGMAWHLLHPKYILSLLKLRKADYFLDISGGDSYSDIYGKDRFYGLDSAKKLFRWYKVKQLMLPQTVGPFFDNKVKDNAIYSIDNTDCVLTRDRKSYDFVMNNCKNKNVSELIDVAFFMPYKIKAFSNSCINVGLNISALLWYGGYTRNNQFNLSVNYPELIDKLILKLTSLPNISLYLIPHVIGPDPEGVENDYYVSTELLKKYAHIPNINVAPYFFTPIEAKNYISGLDFFIGARMHSCIAAFSSSVPVVPMAYSRKFNGLFSDTLSYPYLVDMTSQNEDDILSEILKYYESKLLLKQAIQEQTELINNRYEIIKNKIEDFLK